MRMKTLLLGLALLLGCWTFVTIALIPGDEHEGKTVLSWSTASHPQRHLQAEAFNERNPDLHLRIDTQNTGPMKSVVQCSAGVGADLIGMINDTSYDIYRDAGILMDVTEEAREMGFGPDTLPDAVRAMVMRRDPETLQMRQYVYPANVGHYYIIYNKDIFDRYGVPYPPQDLTWERYIEIGRKLTIYEDDNQRIPKIFGAAGTLFTVVLWEKGASVLNEDGTRCLLGSEAAIDAIEFFHGLFYKHKIEPTPTLRAGVTTQGGGFSSKFFSWFGEQRLAMFFGSRWMVTQFRRYFTTQLEAKEAWEKKHPGEPYTGITPPRIGACLVPRFKGGPRYTALRGRRVGVNKNSPRRKEALHFLKYLASKKHGELLNRAADCKPGNKECTSIEQFRHPDWPGEEEIHQLAIDSIPDGRTVRSSLFVNAAYINKELKQIRGLALANPEWTREEMARHMKQAAERLNRRIAENIRYQPRLKRAYRKMMERGAEPAVYVESGSPGDT